MSPAEFLRWWRLGHTETIRTEPLTPEGVSSSFLYFILSGDAKVQRGGTVVTQLGPGAFVGEMSLVTGRTANAVEPLQTRDLAMWTRIQSAIGVDLVAKIRRGDERVIEH